MIRAMCMLMVALPQWLASIAATADVFNPAYLQLTQTDESSFDVVWRVPTRGTSRLAVNVQFPPDVEQLRPATARREGNYHSEAWSVRATTGLAGKRVSFDGLLGGVTDVIARVTFLDGAEQVERLAPGTDSFVIEAKAGSLAVAATYFYLGVEHILLGLDHLLFVLALLLIVSGWRQILATVTAFTVAHSITLVAAALGWLVVPIAPVEAIIALSIVFVASEALHGARGRPGLTARAPWVVAFSFGLLHGLGFASALSDIGLPEYAIPVALLTFNLGVEAGQVLFVAAVILLTGLLARLPFSRGRTAVGYAIPYAIGSLAAYWTIERTWTGVLGFTL
jgi:hydrogenase/urease accessory protein HupE